MKVERIRKPKFEIVSLEERLEGPRRRIKKCPVNIVKKKDNLINYYDENIELARWLTWEQQTPDIKRESTQCLISASEMSAGVFQLVKNREIDQSIELTGLPSVAWNGRGFLEAGFICPSEWFEAYFAAVITRSQARMDALASFPVEIMKQSATTSDPVVYTLVEVFQSYHHRSPDYPAKLGRAMKELIADGDDWSLSIGMGYLETFAALTTDMGKDFNEVLAKNVRIQEEYHMRERGPDVVPVSSFIPLELLGMACMYHDSGKQVTVDSDSLPRFLIEGTYL